MKEMGVHLPQGNYFITKVNRELVIYVKCEKEGYVIDIYNIDEDKCVDSLCIWKDDLE